MQSEKCSAQGCCRSHFSSQDLNVQTKLVLAGAGRKKETVERPRLP